MSERPCEVQALGRTRRRRVADRIRHGHAHHVCDLNRPGLGRYHDGEHECTCGLRWAQQAADDGPVPTVKGIQSAT